MAISVLLCLPLDMPLPGIEFCLEKQRLISEFTEAVSEFLRVQSEQLKAVLQGDGAEFDDGLKAARKRKDEGKQAILVIMERPTADSQ